MGDDSLCLVLNLKSGLGVALVVGLRVPNSEDWVVILSISVALYVSSSQAYLGGRDGRVLVDDISQQERFGIPLLDQLSHFRSYNCNLLVLLCLLSYELIGISLVPLDLSNLLDQSIDLSS
jgi:hypothetical protein